VRDFDLQGAEDDRQGHLLQPEAQPRAHEAGSDVVRQRVNPDRA
jgi:hypothetical protein